VQRSDLSAGEQDNLRRAEWRGSGVVTKLQKMGRELQKVNKHAVTVKIFLDSIQMILTNMQKRNTKLRAKAKSATDMYPKCRANQVTLEPGVKKIKYDGAAIDQTLSLTQAVAGGRVTYGQVVESNDWCTR